MARASLLPPKFITCLSYKLQSGVVSDLLCAYTCYSVVGKGKLGFCGFVLLTRKEGVYLTLIPSPCSIQTWFQSLFVPFRLQREYGE